MSAKSRSRAEGDSRERALRQALVSLLPHIHAGRDRVYVCVPQEQAIVQQILLPLAAQENLQHVLDYEIERQLPFKREDVYYDFLPAGKRGEKLCVYVFAMPKRALDSTIALLESVGIKPSGVETTVTALANYLLFAGQIGQRRGFGGGARRRLGDDRRRSQGQRLAARRRAPVQPSLSQGRLGARRRQRTFARVFAPSAQVVSLR